MLTIGMISWGAEKTLRNTLGSYYNYGLKAEQKIIILQEGTKEQEHIVRDFGFTPITLLSNVGIARAYKYLLDATTQPHFLFLENDWELIEMPFVQIDHGQQLLRTGASDFIRYRHRTNPGNPLWTRQFENQEHVRPSHLLDSIHWTNPDKFIEVTSHKFEYWEVNPITLTEEDTEVARKTSVWYTTTSQYANWTNNPHMANTSFLKQNVYPRLGNKDLEADIQGWWEQSYFRVAQGDGLFTHNRLD
jgi:hypothetical protein